MCHASRHPHRWYEDEEGAAPRDVVAASAAGAENRDPELRVSQAERDEVATALARHFADGRLTVGEYEERVGAALAARTGRDLEPLLSDLPELAEPTAARSRARSVDGRRDRRPTRAPALPWARALAIAAVAVLAIATGPWALWLLWPALVFTGGCGFGSRHQAGRVDLCARPATGHRADTVRL